MRVAFLAPEGTFTWETAQIVAKERNWPADTEYVAYPAGEAIVAAVADGDADHAVVGIATSLSGENGHMIKAIEAAKGVKVVGEHQRVCHYALMVRTGTELERVLSVHSAKKALDDCAGFLRERLPEARLDATPSTGEGAALVAASHDQSAAIAPAAAARRHGLLIVAENIEDDPNNWTRWAIIGRR